MSDVSLEKEILNEVILTRHRLVASGGIITPFGVEKTSHEYRANVSRCGNDLLAILSVLIYGTKPEKVSHSFPKTWWDAFKLRWFPAWAIAKWPPVVEHVEMRKFGLYPEIPSRNSKGSMLVIPVVEMNKYMCMWNRCADKSKLRGVK